MGYMTTVTFQNDMWDTIRENPEEFINAIEKGMDNPLLMGSEEVSEYGVGNYANGLTVSRSHHADDPRLYYVGQNGMYPIGYGSGDCEHESREDLKCRKMFVECAQRFINDEKQKIKEAEEKLKT